MKIDEFRLCFEYLCHSFDLDFEYKAKSMQSYFESPLGMMTSTKFKALINKAKEHVLCKAGYLPTIKDIVSMQYIPDSDEPDKENFRDASCVKCDGVGFVTISKTEKSGRVYLYSACCDCIAGAKRLEQTTLGRETGCYKNYLSKGYELWEV
jgi:hypothetical protein